MIYEVSFHFKSICSYGLSRLILLLMYYGVRPQLCPLLSVGLWAGYLTPCGTSFLGLLPLQSSLGTLSWSNYLTCVQDAMDRSWRHHNVSHRRDLIKLIPSFLLPLESFLTHFKLMSHTISLGKKGQRVKKLLDFMLWSLI